MKIIVVIEDEQADMVSEKIFATACTGEIDDGKTFVSPVPLVIAIRTEEEDSDVL